MQVSLIPELPTDSADYELLTEAVKLAKDVPGLTCEVGLRLGGGTKVILDAIRETGVPKVHIAIDPYGNIEYHEGTRVVRYDYTNTMRDTCLLNLYLYCLQNKQQFLFFNLEDSEFFTRYADGVPVYSEVKTIEQSYSVVHFDGPHTVESVIQEVDFFNPRSSSGATWVFDDVELYDHQGSVHPHVKSLGWKIVKTSPRKWLYQKS